MSSHPSSAFKSGVNRVMGTVMGAVFGLAVTQVGWQRQTDTCCCVYAWCGTKPIACLIPSNHSL